MIPNNKTDCQQIRKNKVIWNTKCFYLKQPVDRQYPFEVWKMQRCLQYIIFTDLFMGCRVFTGVQPDLEEKKIGVENNKICLTPFIYILNAFCTFECNVWVKLLVVLSIQYDKLNYIHVLITSSVWFWPCPWIPCWSHSQFHRVQTVENLESWSHRWEKNMHIVNTYINTIQRKI